MDYILPIPINFKFNRMIFNLGSAANESHRFHQADGGPTGSGRARRRDLPISPSNWSKNTDHQHGVCNFNAQKHFKIFKFRHPSYYKSVKMGEGLHLKIPSCITPRVHGFVEIRRFKEIISRASQKPRPSKFGELLFSVRGTPVMPSVTAANLLEAKKQDAIVQKVIFWNSK